MSVRARVRRLRHQACVRELAHHWRTWDKILNRIARHKPNACRISPEQFRAAREAVVAACQRCGRELGAHLRVFFDELRRKVEPWVSADAIHRADKEIRSDLLTHSQRTLRIIEPHGRISFTRKTLVKVLLSAAVAVVIFVTITQDAGWHIDTWNYLRSVGARLTHTWYTAGFRMQVGLAVILLMALGWFALRRTRSY